MNILFVSKYNQFRSKVAEAYFNKLNKQKGFSVTSAGLFAGASTPTNVMQVAKKHRLSLKTSRTAMSVNMLGKQDLVILVGNDVPTEIFTDDNPHVRAFAHWKVESVRDTDVIAVETTFREIEKRIAKLLKELGQEREKFDEVDRILFDLRQMGDDQAVAIWRDMGLSTKHYYGADIRQLRKYSKPLVGRHKLAQTLWRTNVHDARLLATMIEDSAEVTENQVETWIRQADFWDITDKIATEIIVKTDFGTRKIKPWLRESNDHFRRTGWILVDYYAKHGGLSEDDLNFYLKEIDKMFNRETNWVQEAMLYALASMGKINPDINNKALKIALKVSGTQITYGQVVCDTPRIEKILSEVTFAA